MIIAFHNWKVNSVKVFLTRWLQFNIRLLTMQFNFNLKSFIALLTLNFTNLWSKLTKKNRKKMLRITVQLYNKKIKLCEHVYGVAVIVPELIRVLCSCC